MKFTDDWSVANGKTVEAIAIARSEDGTRERFIMALSDDIDIDVRVDDNGKLSVGVRVPEASDVASEGPGSDSPGLPGPSEG